jgi:hypothetical protein
MVSSTDGSPTNTGWKRRSRAASFSMCLRYSSSVVAPMQRSSPRASMRLEHVAGVHGALGRAGADDGVQLVDEEDDLALGVGDLLEHGLEAVLELAAVLGAGDHAPRSREMTRLFFRISGTSPDDALGEALDDGGLADAGLADEHRVVLGAPGEHLDDAADLLVAADDRVELALAGARGEVGAVLLERLVLPPRGSERHGPRIRWHSENLTIALSGFLPRGAQRWRRRCPW